MIARQQHFEQHFEQRERLPDTGEPRGALRDLNGVNLLFFVAGLTTLLPVVLVGKIAVAEIIGTLFILWSILRGRTIFSPQVTTVYVLGTLWLVGLAISGYVNGQSNTDVLRAAANGGFLLVNLAFFYLGLLYYRNFLFYYVSGGLIAACLRPFTDPDLIRATTDYLQTAVLPVISSAVLLFTALVAYRSRGNTVLALAFLAIASASCDARLSFAINGCATVVLLFRTSGFRSLVDALQKRLRPGHYAAMLVAGYLVFLLLIFVSSQGYLGQFRQQQVASMSNQFNPLEYVVYNGRSGLAAGYVAISERPFIGHGPRADGRQIVRKARRRFRVSFQQSELAKYGWVIPTHSVLLGAWVDAGILGAIFWFYAVFLLLRYGLYESRVDARMLPWFCQATCAGIASIFLSPLSYSSRQAIPLLLAIVCCQSATAVLQTVGSGESVLTTRRRMPNQPLTHERPGRGAGI